MIDISKLRDPEIGETCPSCLGQGEWYTECCSGAHGCSCMGQIIPMGQCQCCHGTGVVDATYEKGANISSIAGLSYIGSGPR